MPRLTLDLTTSASLLGTEPELLLQFIQREQIPGVLFFDAQPKVSVFTLANLLNTTPEALMEWLEDEALAEWIEEVNEDEWFEGEAGKELYESVTPVA
ncbi:hypothetical protein [Egbenema bharatensis]|uniref:hypothetical protein n=1 Tax=Egbenema bharatensis TaxID=3463334 RepID=UPI003A8C3875